MNVNTKKWGIIGTIVVVVLIAIFMVTRPTCLSEKYVANTGSSLVFKGDKFEEFENGRNTHEGTYKIEDSEIKMKFSDGSGTTTAKLTKDKQSFSLKSTGNAFADLFAQNIKYTKE
ncbi:hypothetical protein I6H67_07075 [Pediococcus pentosaceus]|uniref:hypothetical protein n=1 Tax=Pediococcus pentosaceus TaxID=1255 RepID=UPI0018E0EFA5|nr:hypothetical protein [Pediococcus pentosaceus]MBF7104127.1 hypothetical protein [Pediococcus pentosaceus]QQC60970.1 hypothetical protein I6H67_07075 [Pediococcus pentosaceus]